MKEYKRGNKKENVKGSKRKMNPKFSRFKEKLVCVLQPNTNQRWIGTPRLVSQMMDTFTPSPFPLYVFLIDTFSDRQS